MRQIRKALINSTHSLHAARILKLIFLADSRIYRRHSLCVVKWNFVIVAQTNDSKVMEFCQFSTNIDIKLLVTTYTAL